MKSDFLEARDARQQLLDRCLVHARLGGVASVFFISSNIPGSDKHRPGVYRLLYTAMESLNKSVNLVLVSAQNDLLGPFHIAYSSTPPLAAKKAAIDVESQGPHRRLLDVDVYKPNGLQVDRATLGLKSRLCLVCGEPARECILLQRHSSKELILQVDALLHSCAPVPKFVCPKCLATNLKLGALRELNLTPKPGLVDCSDSGSHHDLSYEKMCISVELLPSFFEDVINCHQKQLPMMTFVQTGIAAEIRMISAINCNAHKGFIFLSGMLLMATCMCNGQINRIPRTVSSLAKDFFTHFGSTKSRSTHVKHRYGIGGIRAEIERGLPSILDYAWPRYREAIEAGWDLKRADFYLMALLMQRIEDTTAIHRCGLDGLTRLRNDGKQLQMSIENQKDPEPMLQSLNQDYRKIGLTMGGVADCMALTFAIQGATALSGWAQSR